MARRVIIKKKKKRIKERPFNDEDTDIQIHHDFVRVYCLEPLDRKAKDDPVLDRVLTKEVIQDYEIQDEDDDAGVRTRKRYLPKMPTHLPFLKGIKNADDAIQTRDLELSLRYYNDAIRSNKEMAKIFLLGIVRQLRYWILAQQVRPELADEDSHLLYIRNELLPLIVEDFKNVERYMTPEFDLELFRRFPMEITNLTHEIDEKLHEIHLAREQLEEKGFDPLDPNAPQFVEIPSTNIIEWILENPDLAQIALDNPEQRDELIFGAWKELFQTEGVIQFLELQDKLSELIQFDFQRKQELQKLQDLMKKSSIEDLAEELERPENYSIRNELLDALNISRSIGNLELLQTLENLYESSGKILPQNIIAEPEHFVDALITQNLMG